MVIKKEEQTQDMFCMKCGETSSIRVDTRRCSILRKSEQRSIFGGKGKKTWKYVAACPCCGQEFAMYFQKPRKKERST